MNILIIHTAFIGDIVLSTALVSTQKLKKLLSMIKEEKIRASKHLFLLLEKLEN